MREPTQDGVILLHGIFRTARSMARMRRFLAAEGYATLNIDYPSTKFTLDEIADHLAPQVDAFAKSLTGTVHFVGYSMGGLVIRYLLARHAPGNLGRVVMLGTPNQGSEIADFCDRWSLYRKIYGPAGRQLTTAYAHAPAALSCDVGILAGNRSWDPVCNHLIGRPNDGKVSVESTKLAGMAGHRILPASHVFFPLNRTAWHHTLSFLKTGRFAD